jgi:hypothetical protein
MRRGVAPVQAGERPARWLLGMKSGTIDISANPEPCQDVPALKKAALRAASEAGERKMKSSLTPRIANLILACLVVAPAALATLSVAARIVA